MDHMHTNLFRRDVVGQVTIDNVEGTNKIKDLGKHLLQVKTQG